MNTFGPPALVARPRRGRPRLGRRRQGVRRPARRHRRQRPRPRPPGRWSRPSPRSCRPSATSPTSSPPSPRSRSPSGCWRSLGWPDGRVFFTNSGAEANEAAFKLTRRTGRTHIVAAEGAFHGRTMGALALTAKAGLPRAVRAAARRRHLRAVRRRRRRSPRPSTDADAAVVLEPIQGEAGVVVPPDGLPRRRPARSPATTARCSGSTRCRPASAAPAPGSPTSAAGVDPDVVTLAKGLGGGIPIGACRRPRRGRRRCSQPGNHGTTFGGNPVACAAALAVLDTIEADGLLEPPPRARRAARRRLLARAGRRRRGAGAGLMRRPRARRAVRAVQAVAAAARRRLHPQRDRAPRACASSPPLVDHPRRPRRLRRGPARDPRPSPAAMPRRPAHDPPLPPRRRPVARPSCWRSSTSPTTLKAAPFDHKPLAGPRTVALVFDRPTLRTQVSFAAGIAELGDT